MRQHARRAVVGLALLALVVSSCGGGADEPAADDGPPPTESSTGDGAAPNAGGSGDGFTSGLGLSVDDPTVVRAGELAVVLVGDLGDDDTAVGALLLAGDMGYDGLQIESAIVAGTLAADGTIGGVAPNLAAYGKVAGFRSAQEELLPIGELRVQARETGGDQDVWPEGTLATAMILQWQLQGFSQEQIVEMLILGAAQLDGDYEGDVAVGEEECGGYVIGGVHEIPDFCDPDTGELYSYGDEPATTDAPVAEPAEPGWLCDGAFAPPYSDLPIEAAGVMLETEILGPLETPYYYAEVSGFLDVAADGSVTLTAHTVRYADITIRDAPDNQIYIRDFTLTGSIDAEKGDGEMTGSVEGTDQLWSGDAQSPISAEASGELAVVCDDTEAAGFAVFGLATGNGILEFEARP